MSKKILLTSFNTWKTHQKSNSSDDLLEIITRTSLPSMHFLRKLPVDFQLAPQQVLAKFKEFQPHIILLCGMAETRSKLHLESRAVVGDDIIETTVDLEKIRIGLATTEISHDAGHFVCNELYYRTLTHLAEKNSATRCLFIHIPCLTAINRELIIEDFNLMIKRLLFS